MSELKAGASINRQNMTRLQTMHDMAVQMGATCGDGEDYTPIGKHAGVPLTEEMLLDAGFVKEGDRWVSPPSFVLNDFKAGLLDIEESNATPYASMKAVGDRLIEVKVAYGGHKGGKDSHGEYFSPNTDFDPENFPAPPLLYYHGFDANGKKMGKPAVTGKFQSRRTGTDGHYLTYKLKNTKYADLQWESAQANKCVVSPGTVGHLIRKDATTGELLYWPLAEISAWDYAPNRAPANLHSVAAPVLKALYQAEGISTPSVLVETTPPETEGDSVSAGVIDIPPEEAGRVIAAQVANALLTLRKGT